MSIYSGGKSIGDQQLSGVVVRMSSTELRVAFDELPGDAELNLHGGRLQLVKISNSATYRRMKK